MHDLRLGASHRRRRDHLLQRADDGLGEDRAFVAGMDVRRDVVPRRHVEEGDDLLV